VSQPWKYYTLQLKSTISVYFIGKVKAERVYGMAAPDAPAIPTSTEAAQLLRVEPLPS
jgi:hypothetical protein